MKPTTKRHLETAGLWILFAAAFGLAAYAYVDGIWQAMN